MQSFTGQANNRAITIALRSGVPVLSGTNVVWRGPITLQPTGGYATNQLLAATYLVKIDGVNKTWVMPVPDSTNTYNALDLISQGISSDDPWPALTAGNNVTITTNYVSGFPVLTLNALGGTSTNGGTVVGPSAATVGELPYLDQITGQHLGRSGILYTDVAQHSQIVSNISGGSYITATPFTRPNGTRDFQIDMTDLQFKSAYGNNVSLKTEETDFEGFTNSIKSAAFQLASAFDTAGAAAIKANTNNPSIAWARLYNPTNVNGLSVVTNAGFASVGSTNLAPTNIVVASMWGHQVGSVRLGSTFDLWPTFDDVCGWAWFGMDDNAGGFPAPLQLMILSGYGNLYLPQCGVQIVQTNTEAALYMKDQGGVSMQQVIDGTNFYGAFYGDGSHLTGLSGGGTVTSVNVAQSGFTSSGAVTGSGTVTLTRSGDINNLQKGQTNISILTVSNSSSLGGQTTMGGLVVTNGVTNLTLTASTDIESDSHQKIVSLANAFGVKTNDGAGNVGYNNKPILDLAASTNSIPYTNYLAGTNITATFDGGLHSGTITNGPDVFITLAGANGSWSWRIRTNILVHLPGYDIPFLSGSNISSAHIFSFTNGVLSLTSYGGTNGNQMEAAGGEN